MVKVDSKKVVDSNELIDAFSNNYYELMKKYDDVRSIVTNLNVNIEDENLIEDTRAQLNENVGDFMQDFLGTISETKLPNKWVIDDNQTLERYHVDEVLGYSHLDNPKKILEKAIFETYEDGLCARMAHFANITKHDIDDIGIAPIASKIGMNSNNLSHIRSRMTGNKSNYDINEMLDVVQFANSMINKYGYSDLKGVDNAINNPNDEKNKTINDKLHGIMKMCGMKNFSTNNTKEFIKLIKCYKLNNKLTNLKEQGIRSCIYNIQMKDKLASKKIQENPNADISAYKNEVLVGYFTEDINDFSIKGKPATRLVIAGESDRFSMQFHESNYAMNKIKKDLGFKVEENIDLKDKTNLRIPFSDVKDKNRIENFKATVDGRIFDKLKDIGFGIYNTIKKGYIGKLVSLNKENMEKSVEER